jgi:AraC-like DNA-binding protein
MAGFEVSTEAHGLERILPTGAAQLIVSLKEDRTRLYETGPPHRCDSTCGTIMACVQSRYQIIDTSEQEYVAGVAFRPGGSAAFIRVPADETRDMNTPLEMLWGPHSTIDLREQLLERDDPDGQLDAIENALQEKLRPGGMHPAVDFALAAFDRVPLTANIGAVTSAVGMSAKRFIDRFTTEVGVTPKRYCRIRRFQRALAARTEASASIGLS